jgi:hypothetical protein
MAELRDVTGNTAAVHSLCKLADQLTSKLGPVPLNSLGPLRYRKRKNKSRASVQSNGVSAASPGAQTASTEPL